MKLQLKLKELNEQLWFLTLALIVAMPVAV